MPPPNVERCRSLLAYHGVGRNLVVRLKYSNDRSILGWLASGMAALVSAEVKSVEGSVVCWAPTTTERLRARGYDQAELLARAVSAEIGVPCRGLLTRRPGPAQTGRNRNDRRTGPGFAAALDDPVPPMVLVVDDVITTGATVSAAAAALRGAGVQRVLAVSAASTALKVRTASADP